MFSFCKLIPSDTNTNKQCIQWLSNIPNLQIRKRKTLKVLWLFIMEMFKFNSREKSLMNRITWLQQLSSLCQFCFIFGKSILEQCKSTRSADHGEKMSFMQKNYFCLLLIRSTYSDVNQPLPFRKNSSNPQDFSGPSEGTESHQITLNGESQFSNLK